MWLLFTIRLLPVGYQILNFLNANFVCGWNPDSHSSIITYALFLVSLTTRLLFLIHNLRALTGCLLQTPRSYITILKDLNTHISECLVRFPDTSVVGLEAEQLTVVNNLFQPTDLLTRVSYQTSDRAQSLELTLASVHSLYKNVPIPFLFGSSDHCVMTSFVNCKLPPSSRHVSALQFS